MSAGGRAGAGMSMGVLTQGSITASQQGPSVGLRGSQAVQDRAALLAPMPATLAIRNHRVPTNQNRTQQNSCLLHAHRCNDCGALPRTDALLGAGADL